MERVVGRSKIAAASLAFALMASPGPSRAQQPPGDEPAPVARPGTWRGEGGALGVRAYVNTEPRLLPIDDMFTVNIPDASTSWDSTGDAGARASSVFPGQTVVGLPDLLTTFGVPGANELLPTYPLTVFASPTNPEAATADGAARATVDPGLEFIESTATLSVSGLTDVLWPFMEFEPIAASSRQSFEAGALVSRSLATVESVEFLGGLIALNGIDVRAETTARASGAPTADTSVDVAGASILGVPVAIREDGIEVGGMVIPPGGFPEGFQPAGIAGAINRVVAALGIRIQLLGTQEQVEGQSATASANGVLVELRIPVDGPQLPTVALNQLPVDVNDLLADVLPLPLPDADANVLYRTYVLSAVIGEARAEAFAGDGFGGGVPRLSAPAATASAGAGPLAAGGTEVTDVARGSAPAPPAPASSTAVPTTGVASTDPELRLLVQELAVVFAVMALLGMAAVAAVRTSTSVLRTPRPVPPLHGMRAR